MPPHRRDQLLTLHGFAQEIGTPRQQTLRPILRHGMRPSSEEECKAASFSRFAGDAQLAADQHREGACDEQAQTAAAKPARAGDVYLLERLEKLVALFFGQADAGVDDVEADALVSLL